MKSVCILAFAWFLCASFIASPARAEEKAGGLDALVGKKSPLKAGDKIAFLGDSITEVGAKKDGYIWVIEQALTASQAEKKIELVKTGRSGNKVPDLQNRVEKDVISKKPTIVFIYIGINDVWHSDSGKGTPKDKFEAGLLDVIKRVQDGGAIVVLATPSVIGEKTDGTNKHDAMLEEYANISRKIAKDGNLVLCDLRKAFLDHLKESNKANKEAGILTGDRVHLNAAGNKFVADCAAASIAEALSKRK